jgi:hypothetical protein
MKNELDFDQFVALVKMPEAKLLRLSQTRNRGDRGLLVVQPNEEPFFGHSMGRHHSTFYNFGVTNSSTAAGGASLSPTAPSNFVIVKSQHNAMELYESRIASMQRFMATTVMFHEMGHTVETFFETTFVWVVGLPRGSIAFDAPDRHHGLAH